jgi:outer membrane protein assembly factor BamB
MTESFLVVAPPANPGDSGTAILFDSTYSLLGTPVLNTQGPYRRACRSLKRAQVSIYITGQNATFIARTLASGSTSWRTYNGTGSGETVTASTFFERDVYLLGDDFQLYIANGATAPTVWEVSIKLRTEPGLAQ